MKVISIVLLLASIASVRSISTLKFILSHGVWMTDPTGNTMTHLGLASFELLVNNIFTPFERALSVTDDKGQRVYTCKYSPKTGSGLAEGRSVTVFHQVLPGLVIDITDGNTNTVAVSCTPRAA
ncbi:uncharacterized protein MKK02DRAFT_28000 [Dioszegia hungarica]|uniref:Uncharacterized protein n=1 Tax=Dioszegia hungarica TaxID=4972 RepID=A0AA38H657_9TREE|nr:uncharacterized protein MKK02DRAFT_28000 [Dioszegia hungarica]KAI9634870.1 hypothetical protein MKK02DRAFT_28000 [Dioszegia hungarica]